MAYWRAGARHRGRIKIEEPAQAMPKRGRMQMLMTLVCVLGVLIGVRMTHKHDSVSAPLGIGQTPAGTWELQSVNGDPVGVQADSVILSQRLTLRDGKLEGETHLRADTPVATTTMPFPDDSVNSVTAGADGHEVVVTWDGTYTLKNDHILELQVGGAIYRATFTLNPTARTLEFDHDAILTFKGVARYQAAADPAGIAEASQ